MKEAIFPGSFDPPTLGHVDLIRRAASMTDHLVVAVLNNCAKIPLFSVKERVTMLSDIVSEFPNVEVCSFEGLLVDFARERSVSCVIRGLRGVTDFLYEQQMADVNRLLQEGLETVFLMTDSRYAAISSSAVREVAMYGGDVSRMVPSQVLYSIREKYR